MKTDYEDAIERVIQGFDFGEVYSYMRSTGWTYFDSPNTPTIDRLKETARGLLQDATKIGTRWVRGGGFRAELVDNRSELTLEFVLTSNSEYV